MNDLDADLTDDGLYDGFVAALTAAGRPARDLGDDAIEVRVDRGSGPPRTIQLPLTRPQLRGNAWRDFLLIDVDQGEGDELADDPVRNGLAVLAAYADDALDDVRDDETFLVLMGGFFHASVRRALPPVRGTEAPLPECHGEWFALESDGSISGRVGASFAEFTAAAAELERLLGSLQPVRRPGLFVFTSGEEVPTDVRPVVTVREDEGVTLVLAQEDADRLGLTYDFVAAMVTLQVRSSLHAVGLTAVVARELTDWGIGCNVVAGFFHDHLFVPADRADQAVERLVALSQDPARWT